jgi:uncharacterized protein (TIGR03067 family)
MTRRLALVAAVICLTAGCDSRTDPEKLQGEWQMRAMYGWFEFDLPAVKGGPAIITFTDDGFTFINDKDPKQRVSGTFTCDASKSPKQITFNFNRRKVVGIYFVAGGTLRICVDRDDRVPPKEFQGGPGEKPAHLIFERPRTN